MVNGAVASVIIALNGAAGTTAWYLTDNLGSVRDIVSTSGTSLDHIVYDSFGNVITETNATNGDRFRFAGMQYDATTGQYYDHARNYSPGLGRFTALDPLGFRAGDPDLYRYVANSPSNGIDPSGTDGEFSEIPGSPGGIFGSSPVQMPGSLGDIANLPTGPINPGDIANMQGGGRVGSPGDIVGFVPIQFRGLTPGTPPSSWPDSPSPFNNPLRRYFRMARYIKTWFPCPQIR